MKQVCLGYAGTQASVLGLGCSRLGSTQNVMSAGDQRSLLDGAFAAGVTLFDTANIYGQGDSERILGSVFAARRSSVVLMTKAGQRFSRAQRLAVALKKPIKAIAARIPAVKAQISSRRSAPLPTCFAPDYLRHELEGSLTRLQTSYVDIFFLHGPQLDDLDDKRILPLMDSLKAKGFIRAWGISCDGAVDYRALLTKVVPDVLQISLMSVDQFDNRKALQGFQANGGVVIVREIASHNSLNSPATMTAAAIASKWAAVAQDAIFDAALCGTSNLRHLRDAALAFDEPQALRESRS